MKNPWKKLSSKIVHKNNWYHVRKDKVIRPDGSRGEYNVMVTPTSVFIVPINDKNEVYLVGQFRYTTSMYSIEVPAGNSDGKNPLSQAKKELKEEAGLTAKNWKLIGKFQAANGFMSEIANVYLATGLKETPDNSQEEEGIQEVLRIPLKKALKMIDSGEITDAQTIVSLYYAQSVLKETR